MPEIRASQIGSEYDPDRCDPLIVARDEYGVLRPVTRVVRMKGEFVSGSLRGCEEVLVLETEND
jgi:hypothetical protein